MKKPLIKPVSLSVIESDVAQLQRLGVDYGYGAKAGFGDRIGEFDSIDCSGFFRWEMYRASKGALIVPDGSQMQLAWAERNLVEVNYRDAARYMTQARLFAAFIKPWTNGCGRVGHVWFLSAFDDGNNGTFAGTIESHGGAGVNSRPWNSPTLLREVYKCFEIPTLEAQGA